MACMYAPQPVKQVDAIGLRKPSTSSHRGEYFKERDT